MPMKLSCPSTPPDALILKPNPTMKNVRDDMAMTSIVFKRMTLFCFILMEPVSFIMKPTYARITMTTQMTTHTVSKISLRVVILLAVFY